ncbi:MAG: DNA polymerase III subunit gamma/tau [Candidatus Absconditabacterales bacterium]
MSLYLKYRSQTFDDIVEQEYTKDILKQQVIKSFEGENFSNYLFHGSRGIGKTSIARIVARALNCSDNHNGNPCNVCENCQLILHNKTVDIVEIDAASHTGVDNIRDEIINKAIYPPTQLRKKVYIIDEVHMLSTGAFNALLKIMEEPPSYLVFILATTDLHKVPDTILSRCQLFSFKKITVAGIVSRLSYICSQEHIAYDSAGLELIAKLADGGMRDAVKYLDQVSILGRVDEHTVSQCLGVTSDAIVKEFVDIVVARDAVRGIRLIADLQEASVDIYVFLKDALHYIDNHVSADTMSRLLPVAQFIKQVYEKLKYFPHPMVLLKAELLTYTGGAGPTSQIGIDNQKAKPVAPSVDAPQAAVDAPQEVVQIPVAAPTPQVAEVTVSSQSSESPADTSDFDALKERIVSHIASQSLKNIRESSCHIDSIQGGLIKVHVIENGKMTLLNMATNKQTMEKLCSEILDKTMQLQYEFIEKEEFLKKGLGGLLV